MALLESRRLAHARCEARTDELTNLPNRRRFLEFLRDLLESDGTVAVMLGDLVPAVYDEAVGRTA
ncbi:hypothetical protein BH10ACT10_BH10ACT10_15440 [soil metagenome]